MSRVSYIFIAILSVFVIVLTVIGYKSEETIIREVNETVTETFENDVPVDNYNGEHFSFYLPDGMEVREVDKFNAIVTNGNKTMIVFFNSLENNQSTLNFEAAKIADNVILLESFSNDNMFGYLRLLPTEEDSYEIQVGIGGAKVTTKTTKGEMIQDAENLMKIALSIVN